MKIKQTLLASLATSLVSSAAVVQIDSLGFNTNGVAFNATNQANASNQFVNGEAYTGGNVAGATITTTLTYNNLDLDGDSTANDSVTFTIDVTSGGPGLLYNQGFHTNWGTLDGMVISVATVSGTTTDSGDAIVFDGFTGVAVGAGNGNETGVDKQVTINGSISASMQQAATGSYIFLQDYHDFDPAATIAFTDSISNSGGTLVARNMDLQFSTVAVPEPSSALLVGLGSLGLLVRRHK